MSWSDGSRVQTLAEVPVTRGEVPAAAGCLAVDWLRGNVKCRLF